jgi:hypothetical protein
MSQPKVITAYEGEPVSAELSPLLLAVYDELARGSEDHASLKDAIEGLLSFLASPVGRTNANCWAADLFFALGEGWEDVRWEHVPDQLGDVLGDMAMALHDTVKSPEIAENFDSTPEQLLARVRAFEIAKRAV